MKIEIGIEGVSPLLMNRFIDTELEKPAKEDKSAAPEKLAEKFAYKLSDGTLYIPGVNLFSCLIAAGIFQKNGKMKMTTAKSSLVSAGLSIMQDKLSLGTKKFEVDSRSVVNPGTGGRIMKHRACVRDWKLNFTVDIDSQLFNESQIKRLVEDAGIKIGLGDFRPSRKGWFGKFKIAEWKVVN